MGARHPLLPDDHVVFAHSFKPNDKVRAADGACLAAGLQFFKQPLAGSQLVWCLYTPSNLTTRWLQQVDVHTCLISGLDALQHQKQPHCSLASCIPLCGYNTACTELLLLLLLY
jgi:hypothetical protein